MSETKVSYCPICELYWYWVSKHEVIYRLLVFAPIKLEKCPSCVKNNNKPTQKLIDFKNKLKE